MFALPKLGIANGAALRKTNVAVQRRPLDVQLVRQALGVAVPLVVQVCACREHPASGALVGAADLDFELVGVCDLWEVRMRNDRDQLKDGRAVTAKNGFGDVGIGVVIERMHKHDVIAAGLDENEGPLGQILKV